MLFWDDALALSEMKENAPDIYKDKVEEWMHQSNGMHQYHLWCTLEALGLGVNLQHYNPLIDGEVRKRWSLPERWKLKAQMVFGMPKEAMNPERRCRNCRWRRGWVFLVLRKI